MRKTVTLLIGAASVAALLAITACKQFLADIEEDFSYWAAEPVITGFKIDPSVKAQQNNNRVLCVPSAGPVTVTMEVHNPKNFSFIMPNSPGSPTDIVSFGSNIHDSSGINPPAVNADYTLLQSAHDTLTLTYKPAFLKRYEHSRANIGASIKLYSTDGRKFSQNYKFDLEANTPPQLSYVTIGKTADADAQGKYYYVIILKAEDMTETAATASELLHEDITTLAVEGGESAGILFTSGNTGFFVDTGVPVVDRRLLAAGEVDDLTAADFNGTAVPPGYLAPSGVSDPWALRYKTNIVVKAASKTYTFRLTDKKGLSSSPVSASTSKTKAQDAQLFDGTTEISGTGESSPYSMNAELSAASVSVTARTTTADAKITGMLEKPNDSSWVPRTIDSGSWSSAAITLPAPIPDQEALYKITVAAGGDGFVPGTEKVFYVKVTKSSTVTINSGVGAWMALKDAVENGTAHTVIVDGTITAPGADKQIQVNRTVKIMGKTGKTHDILDADDRTFIFDIWPDGNLTLEKLTLQKGNNTVPSGVDGGGAIYCGGGKLNTDDVIIEECTAKNGGGIYAKNVAGAPEIKLTNTKIIKCKADRSGGAIYVTDDGLLTLDNATIGGTAAEANKAVNGNGGGIYVTGDASCTLDGVTMQGNTAPNGKGSAVYVAKTASDTPTLTLKGNVQIGTSAPNSNTLCLGYALSGSTILTAFVSAKSSDLAASAHINIEPEDYIKQSNKDLIKGESINFNVANFHLTNIPASEGSWSLNSTLQNNSLYLARTSANLTASGTEDWKALKETIESLPSSGGTLTLSGTFNATSGDDSGEIIVRKNLTIDGGSSAVINANGKCRIFRVEAGVLTLKDITLENGNALGDSKGGGVYVSTGQFTMQGSTRIVPPTPPLIAGKNDVYLKDSRMINIVGVLTGAKPVASITPEDYTSGTQVLDGDITGGTPPNQNYKKFKVTQGVPQLYVGSDGKLTTTPPLP